MFSAVFTESSEVIRMAPPSKVIDHEKVTSMRKADTSWVEVAKELKVSKATLKAWQKRVNFVDPLVLLDGEELDEFVLSNAGENIGEVRMMQLLIKNGFRARRHVLRESIGRVDEEGRNKRKCVWLLYGTEEDPAEPATHLVASPVETVPTRVAPPSPFYIPSPQLYDSSPSTVDSASESDEEVTPPATGANTISASRMGRNAVEIDLAKVTDMRRDNIDWKDISREVGVSKRTLKTWRKKVQFEEPLAQLSSDELDRFVQDNAGWNIGEKRLMQLLIASGFKARREVLRESIVRIDGDARNKRKRVRLSSSAGVDGVQDSAGVVPSPALPPFPPACVSAPLPLDAEQFILSTGASASTSRIGRKPISIDVNTVTNLRRDNIDWKDICREVGVSKRTLKTWRKKVQFEEPLAQLSSDELDRFVLDNAGWNIGEKRLMQLLIASGFKARREVLRESIVRVDGDARNKRKRMRLHNIVINDTDI